MVNNAPLICSICAQYSKARVKAILQDLAELSNLKMLMPEKYKQNYLKFIKIRSTDSNMMTLQYSHYFDCYLFSVLTNYKRSHQNIDGCFGLLKVFQYFNTSLSVYQNAMLQLWFPSVVRFFFTYNAMLCLDVFKLFWLSEQKENRIRKQGLKPPTKSVTLHPSMMSFRQVKVYIWFS